MKKITQLLIILFTSLAVGQTFYKPKVGGGNIKVLNNGSRIGIVKDVTNIAPVPQQLLAFPSAEGFGRDTSGGRGGQVIHVTNLNNSGAGSLREAIETTGPRTVVFDVGGDIEVSSNISAGLGNRLNDPVTNFIPYGDLTIAGETAPFPGITLTTSGTDAADFGALLRIRASNVIIRYMTFRVNDNNVSAMDALQIINDFDSDSNQGQTFQMDLSNIIIDHVSMSHGSDENFSMLGVDNSTVQNSMMARGQNSYNYLFGQRNYNHSFVGNYLSHQTQRNVLWGYGLNSESFEQINNVVYGYKEGSFVVFGHTADVIGNVYNAFPNDAPNANSIEWKYNETNNVSGVVTDGEFYFSDNYLISTLGGSLYNSNVGTYNSPSRRLTNSVITNIETTQQGIIDRVFQGTGPGNSLYQDSMDAALIADFNNQTGSFFAIDPTAKTLVTRPASDDSDDDDMLDVAEIAIWGNITSTNNPIGDLDLDGYTDIEETHHYLAGDGISHTPPTAVVVPPYSGSIFSDLQGQVTYTVKHRDSLINRLANGPYKVDEDNKDGYFDLVISESNSFNANPGDDIFDWFCSSTPIDQTTCASPLRTNTGDSSKNASDEIFRAALKAYLEDDSALAQKVIDQIVIMSNDDNLDFGNGATKTNTIHGTTQRWTTDGPNAVVGSVNPFFLVAAYMQKCLEAYSILNSRGLITLTEAQYNRLDNWFKECAVFMYDILDDQYDQYYGNGWITDNFSLAGGVNFQVATSSSRTNPFFANVSGTPYADLNHNQATSPTTNTRVEYAGYVGFVGILYDIPSYRDFEWQHFKNVIRFNMYPNGVITEQFRILPDNNSQGVQYTRTALQGLAKMAYYNRVAYLNGTPWISQAESVKMYEYETSEGYAENGMGEIIGNNTSGGPKSLLLGIKSLGKFEKQNTGSLGWNPKYYSNTSPTGDLVGSDLPNTRYAYDAAYIANIYYNDPELKAMYTGDTNFGYKPRLAGYNGGDETGNWRFDEGSWGAMIGGGWGVVGDLDGLIK